MKPILTQVAPVLIAACGNGSAGDDGFGPAVLRYVADIAPAGVTVRDLAMKPASLLDDLPKARALLLVDALLAMDGGVYRLVDVDCARVESLPLILGGVRSTHAMGLGWQLVLAQSLGMMPALARLIALTIPAPAVGSAMSARAIEQIPRAARLAVRWARRYQQLLAVESEF